MVGASYPHRPGVEGSDWSSRSYFRAMLTSPGPQFSDVVPDGPGASVLEDRIVYRLPGGRLAELAAGWLVRRRLDRLFAFRHRVTAEAVIDD